VRAYHRNRCSQAFHRKKIAIDELPGMASELIRVKKAAAPIGSSKTKAKTKFTTRAYMIGVSAAAMRAA